MAATIETIPETEGAILSEGPHWDVRTRSLYYVDIFGKSVHRYVPATRQHYQAIVGDKPVSVIIPIEGETDKFVISYGRQLVTIKWDGISDRVSELTKLCEVDDEPETEKNQFNDGKCDAFGRLWIGTWSLFGPDGEIIREKGGLFSLGPNRDIKKHLSHISLSNGLAWSSDLKKFYYIDSTKKVIDEYEVDLEYGSLSNGKPIFSLEKNDIPGLPDGMTIDTNGYLWIAIFDGGRVIQIDPNQPETLLRTINFPSNQITSVAFGGDNLDELYVTSASLTSGNLKATDSDKGALYRVTNINTKGFPGVNYKL